MYGKTTELVIYRVEAGEHWPRLLSDATKFAWLRVDWGKWVDEDDEKATNDDPMDMSALMSGMGGMPNFGAMGGMGGMGGMPNFDDDDDDDEEDDHDHDHDHGHAH